MVDPYDVILSPWITEKSLNARRVADPEGYYKENNNRIEFIVRRRATKADIKAAIEELLKKIAEQEAEIERRDAVVIKMAEKYQLIEKDDFAEEIERDVDSYTTQETTEPKKD